MLSNKTEAVASVEAMVVDTGTKRDGRGHRIVTAAERVALLVAHRVFDRPGASLTDRHGGQNAPPMAGGVS